MDPVISSRPTYIKISLPRLSLLIVSMILLGFIVGTQYIKFSKPNNSMNNQLAQVTPVSSKDYSTPFISAGNHAIFRGPLGWHIAINYLDKDINHEIFYIDPKPTRFNYPSDSRPKVLMNVYTNQQDPESLYNSFINSFNKTHENITKTELPQAYFNNFIHIEGIIKEPSVYTGEKSHMYIMISSNPQYADLSNKASWNIMSIGPMIESLDDTNKVIEQILQSFRECHFETCKRGLE